MSQKIHYCLQDDDIDYVKKCEQIKKGEKPQLITSRLYVCMESSVHTIKNITFC